MLAWRGWGGRLARLCRRSAEARLCTSITACRSGVWSRNTAPSAAPFLGGLSLCSLWRWHRRAPFSADGVSPRSPATSDDVPPPQRKVTKEDVHVQFARSSGAGGQHVNKVSTKVDMRLKLPFAAWLHPAVKEILRKTEKGRINKDDELVVTSQRTRSQGSNVEDALAKLQEMLHAAWQATQPIPEDLEKKAKLQRQADKADRARLLQKKARGDKKASRRADW